MLRYTKSDLRQCELRSGARAPKKFKNKNSGIREIKRLIFNSSHHEYQYLNLSHVRL